ncbi:transmembrane and death domain protein 1 isoform X1 [Oryzias melastigma]|uniref:transmembrane and death domain protein 1 isoform X1 n=1 Tax=Oryzias melastigma TaxID=30732 RepID=UPI000CF8384E|nr:transmembrane and death domain protein 1 isoform X1 [Oryzias melastigma]
MKVWKMLVFFWMFLPQSWTSGEDTVAEDISVHQLERLVELLTFKECEDLLVALSNPEENIFQHLHLLSPENNPLGLQPRAKRDTSSAADDETQCRTALTGWIVENGERTYYDRLSRALQHIGRTDIAIEVGKNINQDKALSLKRYVEDYHKYVMSLNLPSVREATRTHQRAHQRASNRAGNDLPGPDLVQQGLSAVVVPFLYGALLAIGVTLLAAFLFFIILKRPERSRCLPAIWKKGQS